VEQGRKLYYGRCTACHAPEPVKDYTRAEWATIIPDMADESNLKASQTAALRAYIESRL
jgi:trimethylamine-N-oxide reductase (cytochrome c)